jgi:hypothetical protein
LASIAASATLLLQAAKLLAARGLRTALITNDQGNSLVDSALATQQHLPVVEIADLAAIALLALVDDNRLELVDFPVSQAQSSLVGVRVEHRRAWDELGAACFGFFGSGGREKEVRSRFFVFATERVGMLLRSIGKRPRFLFLSMRQPSTRATHA